jgi:hypothetical protein
MKECKTCKEVKSLDKFYRCNGYLLGDCRVCQDKKSISWRARNLAKARFQQQKQKLKDRYGITLEDYDKMFLEQHGVCKLCGKATNRRRLDIDHCHTTGKIRGLLCNVCNKTLGLLKDDLKLIEKIKEYLS